MSAKSTKTPIKSFEKAGDIKAKSVDTLLLRVYSHTHCFEQSNSTLTVNSLSLLTFRTLITVTYRPGGLSGQCPSVDWSPCPDTGDTGAGHTGHTGSCHTVANHRHTHRNRGTLIHTRPLFRAGILNGSPD